MSPPRRHVGPLALGWSLALGGCLNAGYSLSQLPRGASSGSTPAPSNDAGSGGSTPSGSTGSTPSTSNPSTSTPPTSTDPSTTPGGSTTPAPSTCTTSKDTWDGYIGKLFSTTCGTACHQSEFSTKARVQAKTSSIRGYVSAKSMPPESSDLPQADRTRLLDWLNCPTPLP